MNDTNSNNTEDEISLIELWNIFKNHFVYFLVTVLLVLGVAFLYLQKTVPTYISSVTVLVDPIQSSSSLDDMLSMTSGSSSEISTEVELIKSEKNIQNALDSMDLSLYFNSEGISFNTFYTLQNAINSLSVSSVTDTNLVSISIENENPQFAADLANSIAHNYDTLLTGIAKNSKTVQREFLEQQIPLNEAQLKEASNQLSDYREESGIMQLNEKASSLVNQIAFFDVNKEPLKLNIDSNNELMQKYTEEFATYSMTVPTVEELKSNEDFEHLVKTYITANDKLLMYNLAYSSELASSNQNSTSVSSKTSLLANTLTSTSNKMLDFISDELSSYKTDNVYANKLLSEYGKLVLDIIKTDIELTALDSRSQVYNDELDQLPIIERQVTELTRNVTVLQQVGLELRTMLEQTKLTEAAVSGNVTVIDAAKVPTIPVSPNKLLIMAVALLLGMALGFFVCIILHLSKTSIETRDDLKTILGDKYKLLGWIPLVEPEKTGKLFKKSKEDNEDKKTIPTYDNPTSIESEKYMNITSNIIYGNFLTSNQVMTITSCDISAGKSSIIANIGMCLAKMGSKVIIIDGDFRMPSSLTTFGYSQAKKGSVEVIMGKARLEEVIVQPIEDVPNFNILPVGHKPQVPTSIIAHPYFNKMIDVLKDNFDYILIDTPPLDYASEVLALGKISDSIILTVRAGVTSKMALKDLIESLGPVDEKIIGAVLNGFIPSAADMGGSNGGKYGYGKKYGYGYAYSESENRYDSYTNSKLKKKCKILSASAALKKEIALYEKNLKTRGSKIISTNKLGNTPPIANSMHLGELTEQLYEEIKKDEIIKKTKLRFYDKEFLDEKPQSYSDIIINLQKDKDASGKTK
jgi:capsular exopolysaccharide synthesis family protein